jgi:hypothetical protein
MRHPFAPGSPRLRSTFVAAAVLTLLASLAPLARGERQSSMKLFPRETMLFVRTANAQEFAERLKDTTTGRMLADPQIKPLVDRVLGEVSNLYSQEAENQVGVAWNDLLKLPKGELAFGVIAMNNAMPAFVLLIDEGKEPTVAQTLLKKGLAALQERGGETTKESIDGVEVTIVRDGGRQDRVVGMFERDGTIVAATHPDVLRHVLWHWDGTRPLPAAGAVDEGNQENSFTPSPTLETNEKFIAILRECRRPNDPPPNLVMYADPIELVRQFGRASPGVQIGLALLPQLGLDGVQAVGGAATMATGQYDSLTHVHVLLQNPRAGILSMIAFDTGDNAPEAWVPLDTASYITGRWKFDSFYARLASIVDQFRGEGAFNELVNGRVSQELGIDFKAKIVDNLAGRVTMVVGYDKPANIQSRKQVLAIEVVDEGVATEAIEKILSRDPNISEKRHAGPVPYYVFKRTGFENLPEDQRPMEPFVAVMDKHIFVGTSTKLFEQMVFARQGDAQRLAGSKDHQRVSDVLLKETPSIRPAVFMMSRPELDFQFWYEMLTSERSRTAIEALAADNEVVERFAKILREGGLPPFDVFKKYLAPSGGILYDTDNGFHGISFSLREE